MYIKKEIIIKKCIKYPRSSYYAHIDYSNPFSLFYFAFQLGGKNAAIVFDDADLEKCLATTIRSGGLLWLEN